MNTLNVYYTVERQVDGEWRPCVLKEDAAGAPVYMTLKRGVAHKVGRQVAPPTRVIRHIRIVDYIRLR